MSGGCTHVEQAVHRLRHRVGLASGELVERLAERDLGDRVLMCHTQKSVLESRFSNFAQARRSTSYKRRVLLGLTVMRCLRSDSTGKNVPFSAAFAHLAKSRSK